MLTLFGEGGVLMWFLLALGLATLFSAGRFAWVPVRRTLRVAFALSGATAMMTLAGISTCLSAVGHHAPTYLATHPGETLSGVLLQGMAEALSPGILGFTILSLALLLMALGYHREGVS